MQYVPDKFKAQEMCNKAVRDGGFLYLQYVPDWFVTQQQMKGLWDDDDDHCDDDLFKWYRTRWYEDYKKRKTQEVQIKKELLPIAWQKSCEYKHRHFYV